MRLLLPLLALLMLGCSDKPSLQQYFVSRSENPQFLALDLGPTNLNLDKQPLTDAQRTSLSHLKKVNILAYKKDKAGEAPYQLERRTVDSILSDETFQDLIRFSSDGQGASLKFTGDVQQVDEFILYGHDSRYGFALVRILGDKLTPTDVVNLLDVMRSTDFPIQQLEPLQNFLMTPKKK